MIRERELRGMQINNSECKINNNQKVIGQKHTLHRFFATAQLCVITRYCYWLSSQFTCK